MSKITTIPFAGFYNTIWSYGIDRAEEIHLEHLEQEEGVEIKASSDAIWKAADYGAMYNYVARKYVDYFNDYIKDEFDLDLDLKFESMQSPREYNFETDRIFCYISEENVRKLRSAVSDPALRHAIKERFTSRSGFISSYDNDLDDWNPDPTTWDHNELGTLLVALLDDAEDWDWKIWEGMQDRNVFDVAFDQCVNWEVYDGFVKEEAA